MAIAFLCDGCGAGLATHHHADARQERAECPGCQQGHDGQMFGRLDPAHYCHACAATWQAHQQAVDERRRQAARDFEAWLRAAEAALPLARVPDG